MRTRARTPIALGLLLAAVVVTARAGQPRPVEAGRFEGSWARVEPGRQQALVIRRDGGAWQLRFYWREEGLEVDTDWNERTEYLFKGYPGALELRVDPERSDATRLVIDYHREQRGPRDARLTEDGTLELFRIGRFGRTLVWRIDPVTRRLNVPEPLTPEEEGRPRLDRIEWRFQKQAERELLWDEFYW